MKTKIIKVLNISVLSIFLFGCNSINVNTDQDGKLIKTIEIGKQIWSSENLNVIHFRNGDEIPEAKSWGEYFKYTTDKKPCWSYYDFDKKNEKIYGKLYNWYAVNDKRNLAPEGFKVSSVEDWNELIEFIGDSETSATQLKSIEPNLWVNQSNNIKDSYGFCAKPGGFLTCSTDMGDGFWSLRRVGAWWCSNSIDEDNANSIYMYSGDNEYSTENEIKIAENQKWFALSVRIISEKKSEKKSQEKTNQLSGPETKIMTYQYCECHEMCYSLFTDEEGNEYNFGDISRQSNIGFQCYTNNSEGGITDNLKGQKFKVTYIKIAEKDFELVKIANINSSNNESTTSNNNSKEFSDIQLTLTDATIKKAKLFLGEPDKYEYSFGHITKGFAVYYDKVSNNGQPKHLVLFLRMDGSLWGNNAKIEEIYSVSDNEKACFGIHCVEIRNYEIYTNALDLIYDEGYKQM
jgi:uncharacterized protein (TIGR02145 family)